MRQILDFIFSGATDDFERMACLLLFFMLVEAIAGICGSLIRSVNK